MLVASHCAASHVNRLPWPHQRPHACHSTSRWVPRWWRTCHEPNGSDFLSHAAMPSFSMSMSMFTKLYKTMVLDLAWEFLVETSWQSVLQIRRPGSACTVFFSYVASKICHKIQNPKSPNSKIQNPQNPKSPKFGALGASHKDLLHNGPKSKIPKIQNPKSPKSKIPKIQNPKSEIPKSKIQNPPNPKSKIPKIQNPRNLGPHKELLHNGPKSKIQNPQNRPKKFGFWILDWGFWILDFGPKIQNPQHPKSKIPKIQNPKSPRSKIQNPQNPKSSAKIQNLGRWGPHIKICYITIQNPKSKIPKIQNLGIWDFGLWIRGILDFGDFGFWIWGILDFGVWIWGILDFGSWGFWILDFGFGGFWILEFGFGEVQGMYH